MPAVSYRLWIPRGSIVRGCPLLEWDASFVRALREKQAAFDKWMQAENARVRVICWGKVIVELTNDTDATVQEIDQLCFESCGHRLVELNGIDVIGVSE
jgi:hypothetical protein